MLEQITTYIVNNNVEIIAIIGAINMIATTIARITKTKKDDKVIENLRRLFEAVGNLFLPDRK